MATTATWPLLPAATPPSPTPPSVSGAGIATIPADRRAFLGHCVFRPFQRDLKQDFANTGGVPLVAAAVIQVLGTVADTAVTQGELPWETEFGSALELLRHKNAYDPAFEGLARTYVFEALARWEPRAIVKETRVTVEHADDVAVAVLEVFFDVAATKTPGSTIVAQDLVASTVLTA